MLEIIYKDEHIIAVSKPPGIVVFSEKRNEESMARLMGKYFPYLAGIGGRRNGAIHRLDKDTSGVLLFAKNEKILALLQEEFRKQKVEKKYIALVFKRVGSNEGEIKTYLSRSPKDRRKQKATTKGERRAITRFKVKKRYKNLTLLSVFPQTGRKHQIRCHLAHIGHPISGDKLYRFKDQFDPEGLKRQFLHAKEIKIKTPRGRCLFQARLPKDLQRVIYNLEKYDH